MAGNEKLFAILALQQSVAGALEDDADLANGRSDIFRKFLAVSAASRLEQDTKKTLRELMRDISGQQREMLVNFIEQKVLKRGCHALFNRNDNNANSFYASCGDDFSQFMRQKAAADEGFGDAVCAFVNLGHDRNQLVHNDLASSEFNLSVNDVEGRFRRAAIFLPQFRQYALEFARRQA